MIHTISDLKLEEVKKISHKIDQNTATISDYERYEALLLEAGFSIDQIRSKMLQNGFLSYSEYLKARNAATDYRQKKITNAVIAGALIGFAIAAIFIAIQDEDY